MRDRLTTSLTLDVDASVAAYDVAMMADLFCSLSFNSAALRKLAKQQRAKGEFDLAAQTEETAAAEADAEEQQAQVCLMMAGAFENGNAELGIPRDPQRARKYRYLPAVETRKSTDYVYRKLSLYTAIRLFFSRLNRVFGVFGWAFYVNMTVDVGSRFFNIVFNAITKNITQIVAIAGLSYALEFLADCAMLFRAAFWPTDAEKDANKSGWSRFVNTLWKDDRIPRMLNAAFWFGVNLGCIFATSGLSAILNVGLFAFDVANDIYKAYRDRSKYTLLTNAVSNKIKNLEIEIASPNTNQTPAQLASKQQELAKFQRVAARLEEKSQAVNRKRNYAIFISLVILTGMVLFFFPPAGLTAAALFTVKLVGAGLAMFGSCAGGLGKRIFESITAPKAVDTEVNEVMQQLPQNGKMQNISSMLPKAAAQAQPSRVPSTERPIKGVPANITALTRYSAIQQQQANQKHISSASSLASHSKSRIMA